jgi:Peptidase A4 family
MRKSLRTLAAAAAAAAGLALVPLAAASPSAAPARAAASASAAGNTNWAGYVAVAPKGKKISGVSTSFIVPEPLQKNNVGQPLPYQATMWAGIDGSPYGGYQGVAQAGVWEKSYGKKARVQYLLFWEMYPQGPHFIWNSHVKPGDEVFVAVLAPGDESYDDGMYHFILRVNGTDYPVPPVPAPEKAVDSLHTAEVITEIPGTRVWGIRDLVAAAALDMGQVRYLYADYGLSGEGPTDHGLRPVYPVTQHKITAHYGYKFTPLQDAWIKPSKPSASSPSYGSAWKTDSFTTNYTKRGF